MVEIELVDDGWSGSLWKKVSSMVFPTIEIYMRPSSRSNHAYCNRQPLEGSPMEGTNCLPPLCVHLRFIASSAFQTGCDIGRLAFPKYQTANHVTSHT